MSAVRAAAPLDLVTVRRKLRDVREALAAAVELLGELYDGRAWVALELPSWQALVDQELPELAQLLTVAEKRAVVLELRQRGMSLRAAAAPAGVSAATAKTWADDAGVQLASVTSLDGRVRPGSSTSSTACRCSPARSIDCSSSSTTCSPRGTGASGAGRRDSTPGNRSALIDPAALSEVGASVLNMTDVALERSWTQEGRPRLNRRGLEAGPGPWWDEPDKVQWIDPATDLDCLAVRGPFGAWCG